MHAQQFEPLQMDVVIFAAAHQRPELEPAAEMVDGRGAGGGEEPSTYRPLIIDRRETLGSVAVCHLVRRDDRRTSQRVHAHTIRRRGLVVSLRLR
jgi:hypothetical protein